MPSDIQTSIVIPVYNKWDLTRPCLKAIADTTRNLPIEVILVDNASSDVTPKAAPFLGEQLFGQNFHYLRNEQNRNFAGASNQGARLAKGDFLLFLNNDTETLDNWYAPLLDDFATYPDIAATGPLLVYPATEPFGYTIQHLGVYIGPLLRVGHLYAGLPASSQLAQKRRFFQAITAGCMLMKRELFLNMGLFDEHFRNGFEDVDLCARISSKGMRMTVNPQAKVIHYESQTPGRFAHGKENSSYLTQNNLKLLTPDQERLLMEDGISLNLSPWVQLCYSVSPQRALELKNTYGTKFSFECAKKILLEEPLWETAWQNIIAGCADYRQRQHLRITAFRYFADPQSAVAGCHDALAQQNNGDARLWFSALQDFAVPFEDYCHGVTERKDFFASRGVPHLESAYASWFNIAQQFKRALWTPLIQEYNKLAKLFPAAKTNESRRKGE